MIKHCFLGLVSGLLLTASVATAEDFVPGILKFFPGKWELRDPDGTVLGHVEWNLVAGGKALAGPGASAESGDNYCLAGWDAKEKKWVHSIFFADGRSMRYELGKYDGDTYYGTLFVVEGTGQGSKGEAQKRIIDDNHCQVTQVINGEKMVLHFHRVQD